jgi:hypothetical protein
VFDAPHGPEAIELWDGDVADFGRSAACSIRFAYAPTADLFVHGVAGSFAVLGGRVHVGAAAHAKPLEIEPESGPHVMIAVDEAHSCRARRFTVVVPGRPDPWLLRVSSRTDDIVRQLAGPGPRTTMPELQLSEDDWEVLHAYAAPLLNGGAAIATNAQVAAQLHYHLNTVRNRMYGLWQRMHAAGVVLPPTMDKVEAAVRGARLHGLL